MAGSERRLITILCVACSEKALAEVRLLLDHSQIQILSAATREQAVALCVSHTVNLALIDGDSIRGQELSLAGALKMIRPAVPVVLLEERHRPDGDLPQHVDFIARIATPQALLNKIQELLNQAEVL
ncbi:MAG TPA: hypothetical protein VJN64_01345 [Terriglobales bacterium]|nr:hypothetical protein [Terriglobales bacterium]